MLGWLSWLHVCLLQRSWFQGAGMEPPIGASYSAWSLLLLLPLPPSCAFSCSLSQKKNKIFLKLYSENRLLAVFGSWALGCQSSPGTVTYMVCSLPYPQFLTQSRYTHFTTFHPYQNLERWVMLFSLYRLAQWGLLIHLNSHKYCISLLGLQ